MRHAPANHIYINTLLITASKVSSTLVYTMPLGNLPEDAGPVGSTLYRKWQCYLTPVFINKRFRIEERFTSQVMVVIEFFEQLEISIASEPT
jgi:hypothetical protein